MRRRRRRAEPASIGDILPRWLKRRGLEPDLVQYTIWVRWPELVGERLAAHTEPGPLKEGRLTVKVESSSWLNELSFMRDQLVQQINAGLRSQPLKEVRLVAGPVRQRRSRTAPASPPPPPLPEPQLAEAELAAAQIDDDELRDVVRKAGVALLRRRAVALRPDGDGPAPAARGAPARGNRDR